MKGLFALVAYVLIGLNFSFAQCVAGSTATATSSGNWSGGGGLATWSYTGGITDPNQACTITIPAGITVTIKNNITWYGNVIVYGTLNLDNQLNLGTSTVPTGCGLTLRIYNSGLLAGSGSSDRLIICGNTVITGQPVTPPGAIDWPADGSFSAGDVGGNGGGFGAGGLLPIELLYFRVSLNKEEKQVQIEWATEDEENFSHFVIERAGRDLKFSSLAEVPGAGYNTNSVKKYSTYDENPLVGIGYYRLKAVDIDGSYEYFSVKSVEYNGNKRMIVSPNPASVNGFSYTINFDPGPYDRVTLINQVGTELYSAPVTGTENEFVPESALRPGAYLLRYTSPDFTDVARVFIKK